MSRFSFLSLDLKAKVMFEVLVDGVTAMVINWMVLIFDVSSFAVSLGEEYSV
jgi:hypothetical protein